MKVKQNETHDAVLNAIDTEMCAMNGIVVLDSQFVDKNDERKKS